MQCISTQSDHRENGVSTPFTGLVSPQVSGISLEDQILLTGTRIHLGYDELESIQALVYEPTVIDWKSLMAKARYNGLIPILYQVLKRCGNAESLQASLEALRGQVRIMAHFNQGLFQELAALTQKFQAADLNILAYKGPTLALAAYGDLSLRQSGDLDFLVASDSFEPASQLFQTQGYKIHAEYTWATCFRCHSSNVEIDLHQNVGGLYLPFQLHFQDIWARRQQTQLAGISFNHPCEEDLVVLLCVQFAKDAHDNQRKLIKACDIAAVINRASLDWAQVLAIAHQCKGDRPLKLGLSVVETLFGVELPPTIRAYAHSSWVVEYYRRCICKELFARSADRSLVGLGWRAVFLFQDPLLDWRYNWQLVRLFLHSVVNKIRKRWPNLLPWNPRVKQKT